VGTRSAPDGVLGLGELEVESVTALDGAIHLREYPSGGDGVVN